MDVLPPAHISQSQRSDLRQNDSGDRFGQDGEGESFSAKEEREQFRGDDPDHGVEEDGIAHGIDKDEGDCCAGAGFIVIPFGAVLGAESHANGEHDAEDHRSANQRPLSRPSVRHDEQINDLAYDAHHAIYSTDQERSPTREPDLGVEDVLEILNDRRPTELAHGDNKGRQKCTAGVFAGEHLFQGSRPVGVPLLSLQLDLLTDLKQLLAGEFVVWRRIESDEDGPRFFIPILEDQPARREGRKEQASNQQNRYWHLHCERHSPLYISRGKRASIANPIRGAETNGNHHALKTNQEASSSRWRHFSEIDWHHGKDLAASDTSNETAGD